MCPESQGQQSSSRESHRRVWGTMRFFTHYVSGVHTPSSVHALMMHHFDFRLLLHQIVCHSSFIMHDSARYTQRGLWERTWFTSIKTGPLSADGQSHQSTFCCPACNLHDFTYSAQTDNEDFKNEWVEKVVENRLKVTQGSSNAASEPNAICLDSCMHFSGLFRARAEHGV